MIYRGRCVPNPVVFRDGKWLVTWPCGMELHEVRSQSVVGAAKIHWHPDGPLPRRAPDDLMLMQDADGTLFLG
jgi:hypothetical protein